MVQLVYGPVNLNGFDWRVVRTDDGLKPQYLSHANQWVNSSNTGVAVLKKYIEKLEFDVQVLNSHVRRNKCCGNLGSHSEGGIEYCSTCGKQV